MVQGSQATTFFGHETPSAQEQVKRTIGLVDGRDPLEKTVELSVYVPRQQHLLGGHSMQTGSV